MDLKSEASVCLRLVERSYLEFFFSEDDDCCLSDLSDLLFLSFGFVKDGGSRPNCLVWLFRYCNIAALSGLYGSKLELSLVTSFCNVFSLNLPVARSLMLVSS